MSCIMKYRKRGSKDEWQYHEDGDIKHCAEFLIMNDYDDDYEYEIYEFSESGIIHGWSKDDFDDLIYGDDK